MGKVRVATLLFLCHFIGVTITPLYAMDKEQAEEKLATIGQLHLLSGWDYLQPAEKQQLFDDIARLDAAQYFRQKDIFEMRHEPPPLQLADVFQDYDYSGSESDRLAGRELVRQGAVGCIITAGGSGSRLRFEGPKGCFPISAIKKKSLFQLFAEKVIAAGEQVGRLLPLAIMTSSENDRATRRFFREHDNFGLSDSQLFFFTQGDLPYLDEHGDLFLESADKIARGPDGNGTLFEHFVRSGIWQHWEDQGIRYANVVLIDNPLADPFDYELIGYHKRVGGRATLKGIERSDPAEKVGTVMQTTAGVVVREYSEIGPEESQARDASGALLHRCANLSLFCFDLEFMEAVSEASLPWHLAFKAVKYLNENHIVVKPTKPNSWKFEKFIFDCLPWAGAVRVLLYPRTECFAPLKNGTGPDSPETVRQALQERDRQVLRELTGHEPPEGEIEIDQRFYYPTEKMRGYWKGRKIGQRGYIAIDGNAQ